MGKHATKIGTSVSKVTKMILLQLSLKSAKIIWVSKLSKEFPATENLNTEVKKAKNATGPDCSESCENI